MRKYFLFTIFLALPLFLLSQNISVKSFRLLENDLDALVNYPEIDRSNGEKAALIKVVTTETGFEFGGGQLGIVKVVQKTAEIWVYVPAKLKAITIAHPKLGQLPNRFYNFDIPIVSSKVYEMVLVTGKVETIVKPIDIETQWLIINSEPTGADVYINDQPAGKTPYQNELPVGKYSWRISKELYLTEAGVVELTTTAGKNKLDLRMKANFGSISVKTNPEVNAKVFVNGMDINKTTPCILEKIPSGNLTISAKTDFYSISSQNVNMTPEQNLQISLTASPTFGSINVTTTPESGASVTLNGMLTGKTTPCTLERVPQGEYTINISQEWYETTTRKVTVSAGQLIPLVVEMNPTFAEVTVSTDPLADIYINNQLKSNGTWKGRLNPGVYTFEGKLDRHTSAIERQTIIVGTPLNITLKPIPKNGTLKIISNPIEASISLNGKDYGTTPNTLKKLLIGDYTLTLRKSGYTDVTKTITISENTVLEVNETLPTGIDITISSTPSGAQFSVDGLPIGNTPKTINLSIGNHSLKLVNGSRTIEESIIVSQNGNKTFQYDVNEGKLITFSTNPSGAEIFLENKFIGNSPQTIFLNFEKHNLKIVNGSKVIEEKIKVTQNSQTSFNFDVTLPKTIINTPCNDSDFHSDHTFFRGTGTGTSQDIKTAKAKASLDANSNLAALVNRTLKSVVDRYTSERSIGENSKFEQRFEQLTRGIINRLLNNVSTVCSKTFTKDGKYTVYMAVEFSINELLDNIKTEISKDQILQLDYDKMKFENIFNEKMVSLANEQN